MSRYLTTRRGFLAGLGAVAVGAGLAACGGSGSGSGSSSAKATGNADAVDAALKKGGTITYWSWTPSGKDQVAAFMKKYPNVTVKLVNPGTAATTYTKLQNAITAKSGVPDVCQIEYYALAQFALPGALYDLNQVGFDKFKADYSTGPWGSVNQNNKLIGLPQDSGPMAMFYNKEVFDKHKLTVPKTWDEYVDVAKKLHAADPKAYITSDSGDAGFTTSMIWQAGGKPFKADGTNVTINLADEGTKKWTAVWNKLVEGKLLSQIAGWSDEWFQGLGNGTLATLLTGAWMPGNFTASVAAGKGKWRVAPMPTYDGTAVNAENGGSAQCVMTQSKNPALAAAFLRWLNHEQDSIDIFTKSGGFPSTTKDLSSSSFLDDAPEYFGGQKINEVLAAGAKNVVSGWQYLPYQVYGNSVFADTVGQSYAKFTSLDTGLANWQKSLVEYGNKQGFTVKTA